MSTRKIATSTLWQLASQITMAGLSILTVKFVAVGLSKELAGNYNSAYGFLQLFGILADFGLYAVAVREVSKATEDQRGKVLGTLIVIRFFTLITSLMVALTIVWAIPMWKQTPLPLSVTIASLVPFFTLLAGIVRTVFQIHYKLHYVFIAEVTQRIVTVSLIGMFIWLGVRGSTDLQDLHMFLFVGGLGAFVLFMISVVAAAKLMVVRPHFDAVLLWQLIGKAAPFGIAFLCTALYRQFDVTMIALLREDFELQNAYYGFVIRMTDMGYLLPTFLLNSTLPVLSERHAKGEDTSRLLGKTLLIILLIGSVSALFSWLWARPLIALLTTEAYLSTATRPGSDTALAMMAVPLLLNALILYGFYVLLTLHKWKALTLTLLGAAALSIGLNTYLIPLKGFEGAATTLIVVHIVLAAALLPQGLKALPATLTGKQVGQWAVFSVSLGLMLILTKPLLTSELMTIVGLVVMTCVMGGLAKLTGLRKSLMN